MPKRCKKSGKKKKTVRRKSRSSRSSTSCPPTDLSGLLTERAITPEQWLKQALTLFGTQKVYDTLSSLGPLELGGSCLLSPGCWSTATTSSGPLGTDYLTEGRLTIPEGTWYELFKKEHRYRSDFFKLRTAIQTISDPTYGTEVYTCFGPDTITISRIPMLPVSALPRSCEE